MRVFARFCCRVEVLLGLFSAWERVPGLRGHMFERSCAARRSLWAATRTEKNRFFILHFVTSFARGDRYIKFIIHQNIINTFISLSASPFALH